MLYVQVKYASVQSKSLWSLSDVLLLRFTFRTQTVRSSIVNLPSALQRLSLLYEYSILARVTLHLEMGPQVGMTSERDPTW